MPKLCAYMREFFDERRALNEAEMIEALCTREFNAVELQWIIDNITEVRDWKFQNWAKRELAELKRLSEVLDAGAEFDS